MNDQYVLYSTEIGVFVGHGFGLCFWSKLDPAGQDSAVTFGDEAEAREFLSQHRPEGDFHMGELRVVQVKVERDGYATVDECVAAGLPPWDPDGPPDVPHDTVH